VNKRIFIVAAVALAAFAGFIRSHAGSQPAAASAALHVESHSPSPVRARRAAAPGCVAPRRRRSRRSSSRYSEPRARRMASDVSPIARVDVNSADAAELETLPGIGPRMAERIVAFREQNGPFAALDDLLDVNGLSERVVDELEPYVAFSL
jgi:competence ComEA-like helix-hairpin-helix protein